MNKNFTRILCFSLATLFTCSCSDEGKIEPIPMPDANGSASLPKCEGNQLYDTHLEKCVTPQAPKCDEGQLFDPSKGENGECVDNPMPQCEEGQLFDPSKGENGECIDNPMPICQDGQLFDPSKGEHGECIDNPMPHCDNGQLYDPQNKVCVDAHYCPIDQLYDEDLGKCIPICNCGEIFDRPHEACITSPEMADLDTYQKIQLALQETAMAYYRKGHDLQYETYMRGQYYPPESVTPDQMNYLVCTSFVYAVYYQALNIKLFPVTGQYQNYASAHLGEREFPDVIYYEKFEGDKLLNKDYQHEYRKSFFEENDIQAGDVITIQLKDGGGHSVFVHDLFTDKETGLPNAHILHSSGHETNFIVEREVNTKMIHIRRTHWENNLNPQTGVTEGTVLYSEYWDDAQQKLGNTSMSSIAQITVLRPAINARQQTKYNHADPLTVGTDNQYVVTQEDYSIQDAAWCRMQYRGIDIQKTVDIHAGSTIEPGGQMTYTIQITNHSDTAYKDLYIKEYLSKYAELVNAGGGSLFHTVSSDLKDADEYGSTLTWFIPEIEAGKKHIIQYTIKAKESSDIIGKTLSSAGMVAQIPTAAIKNVIAWSLSQTEIDILKESFQKLSKTSTDGLELIQNAYKEIAYDLPLTDLKLGALYLDIDRPNAFSDSKKVENFFARYADRIPYFDIDNPSYDEATNTALLYNRYFENITNSDAHNALQLNRNHALASIVFNHYYGGVLTRYNDDYDNETDAFNKAHESLYDSDVGFAYRYERLLFEDWYDKPDSRTERENIVYPDTLRDGDILIYANTLDNTYMKNACLDSDCTQLGPGKVHVSDEDGTYAYLYLDGKFQGLNCINPEDSDEECELRTFLVKDGIIPPATKDFIEKKGERIGIKDLYDRFGDLPSLYGKDFYVILRPALQKTVK